MVRCKWTFLEEKENPSVGLNNGSMSLKYAEIKDNLSETRSLTVKCKTLIT